MIIIAAIIAGALLVGGCASLHLTVSNQRLFATPLPPRVARIAGWIALAGALAILLSLMGPATAVFTWAIGLMTVWTIPPVVIGWLRHRWETRS